MHASYSKQVAYNQRVLSAESEIAAINSDAPDFLSGMAVNDTEPIIICVNSGDGFKRREQHIAGQLWMQADRKMTATNVPMDGMANDDESACLSGVAEAVEWSHPMEEGMANGRPTRRSVIYPPTLSEFSRVLTGESFDPTEGSGIAYAKIANACSKYPVSPVLYSAESSEFGGIDPSIVPEWMNIAAQVATGGRPCVLENGPDVCNSASESNSENEEHGEVLKGMYTEDVPRDENGQPIMAKCQLTATQAEILRLAAVLRSRGSRQSSSGYLSSSESESEDSFYEFYRLYPEVPRFSKLVERVDRTS
jgi:hypothetical protein